ncbi:MAG: hypothetical protein MZV49_10715 [Rhodopseudomonas palustris]|nr:hypothetical protein [Rhodopseudomonas palustris]
MGEAIVDALNDDGYLTESAADIARRPERRPARRPRTDVEQVLALVQTLDPAGVGARDARRVHLPAARAARAGHARAASSRSPSRATTCRPVADQRPRRCCAALRGADEDSLQAALSLIRGCHPRPGSAFEGGAARVHRAGRVRAPHRPGLGGRDQPGLGAAPQGEPGLREPGARARPTTRRCAPSCRRRAG